jgi:hypothetical protein
MTLARTLLCSSPLLALALTAALGCEIDKNLGDLDDAGTSQGTGSGTDTAEPPAESSESSDDTAAPPSACLQHETFSCTVPIDCSFEPCGSGPLAEIDENGCLRPRCDSGACPDGYSCVNLGDWGSCAASSWSCEASGDECGCGGTADCNDSVSICVETEIAPPAACNTITDEPTCLDSGCTAFHLVPQVTFDETTGTCACADPEPTCLWFPGNNSAGDDAITPYVAYDGENRVLRLLPASYDVSPLGWRPCSDLLDEEICACAQALSCS